MLYVAWALGACVFVVIAVVNKDSYPSVGLLSALALATAFLGTFAVRAWRLAFEVWPHHVTIRNLFRSYRIDASDLSAATFDGVATVIPGYPGQVVEVECLRLEMECSPYSVDVVATMWLPADEKRALLRRLKQKIKNH